MTLDSATVVTRITRLHGRLTLVLEQHDGELTPDQADALQVARRIAEHHIARIAAVEQQAFQQRVAGYTPAPG